MALEQPKSRPKEKAECLYAGCDYPRKCIGACKESEQPVTANGVPVEVANNSGSSCKEKPQRLPEFASVLRQIKERGEDPYCGFEEVLCDIVRQLERELAEMRADRDKKARWGQEYFDRAIAAERAVQSATAERALLQEIRRSRWVPTVYQQKIDAVLATEKRKA